MAETTHLQPPLPSHTFSLYAGDLHPDVTELDLYNLFSVISPSHTVRLCRNQTTHHSLCYAYINFFFPHHAATALRQLNHTVLKGKLIRIMWVQTDAFLRKTGIGNLFVKNLAVDIDVGKLKDVFGVFGRIISCKIAKTDDGKSKGFGYVQFDSEESAAEALRALDGSVLDGKILTVAKYLNKSERKEPQFTNVFVKNLDLDFTESSLIEKFSEYGKVTSAVIVNDAEGKSRGFGFVNFESHENAKKAIEALNDAEIGSKKWFVGKAMKKSERDAILKRAHQKQKPDFLNLLVRNLATSVNETDLREVFGAFGRVTNKRIGCSDLTYVYESNVLWKVLSTNDGATILKMLDVEHPVAKVIHGNLYLVAKMLDVEHPVAKIHPTSVICGYRLAVQESCKYIEDKLGVK
ncbi:RNA recognition motif domain, eukaryote, Nucleotide-binding alpha-beta plait domain protein [Artemisia annua]|uniref:RNA recognition motif domain, eukaryote, Nucleotide-binding alpha-beta plait domain protein n=1 Tax=Artemisia annua TaxID=35608 RepID=A0A2U1QBA5_ARTAN|nr:RNA recognition motif domain, eukaryote, Nucleotide-binding alpha-beta plait domain protein [Artemisia annua]